MSNLYTFSQVADRLNMDKGNLHRLITKLKLSTYGLRDKQANNQIVKAIDDAGLQTLTSYRDDIPKSSNNENVSIESIFYLILIAPDLSEYRVKLGFTTNLEQRLTSYKTICPNVKVVKTWECNKEWEKAIIDMAITNKDKIIGEEVFDVNDVALLVDRIDNIFAMLNE